MATDPLTRLRPESTTLLLVDLQEKLLPAIAERERVVRAVRLLLRAAAVLGLPVVATTQYERGLGPTVPEVEELLPSASTRLDKTAFSCFDDGRFAELLAARAPGERVLLVAGIEAHICVAGTVLGALRRGLAVEVASDAVGSRAASDREAGLARLGQAGALLTTSEMAVYELLGASGTPAFKAMLPHFKS